MDSADNKKIMSPGQLVLRRFLKNKLAIAGLVIICLSVVFCIVGPLFSPYGEYEIFYIDTNTGEEISMYDTEALKRPGVGVNVKAPISAKHWLGTDADGRDVFTRLMYGGQISLQFGVAVTLIELVIGVLLGAVAGYYGGVVDMIIMRLVEVFYCIPFLPMMLIVSAFMMTLGVRPEDKIYYLMIFMGIFNWAGVARMVRAQMLSIRETEYMYAAKAAGLSVARQIFKHMLPNAIPIIIVMATMDLGGFILTESTLTYLGVGLAFPYASLGNMVNAVNKSVIMRNYLNIWLPPGLFILAIVMAFNFIGDGLRDAFDPKK
ncbi:MAG: ABC transporter permease [Lachnospiraceae bacterium]|nr:ABC transporter permease [Lachnospiraceae bacterium]